MQRSDGRSGTRLWLRPADHEEHVHPGQSLRPQEGAGRQGAERHGGGGGGREGPGVTGKALPGDPSHGEQRLAQPAQVLEGGPLPAAARSHGEDLQRAGTHLQVAAGPGVDGREREEQLVQR